MTLQCAMVREDKRMYISVLGLRLGFRPAVFYAMQFVFTTAPSLAPLRCHVCTLSNQDGAMIRTASASRCWQTFWLLYKSCSRSLSLIFSLKRDLNSCRCVSSCRALFTAIARRIIVDCSCRLFISPSRPMPPRPVFSRIGTGSIRPLPESRRHPRYTDTSSRAMANMKEIRRASLKDRFHETLIGAS